MRENFMGTLIKVAIFLVMVCIFFAANYGTPSPKIKRALEYQGLVNIHVGGWDAFECSPGDTISRGFTAQNASKQNVEGTVCCGVWIGGCMVRWP